MASLAFMIGVEAGHADTAKSPPRRQRRAHFPRPTQTIRIIAGYPAGGGIDLVARMLAEPLRTLAQSRIKPQPRPTGHEKRLPPRSCLKYL